jgi:cytochrome c oxidase subunit 2
MAQTARFSSRRHLVCYCVYTRAWRWLLLVPLCTLCACSLAPSPLAPASPRGDDLRSLWWVLFAIAVIVLAVVTALLVWAAVRSPTPEEQQRDHPFGTRLVWIGGIIIPLIILAAVFALSVARMRASDGATPGLTIDVIGHQWWWEIRYPQGNVTTANEIHLPAGQRAHILVGSADVIHGFWVPRLQGKIDAIPGQTNSIDLESDQPGDYRGECLVYCALQHANMNLLVIVEPKDDFDRWLSSQASAPPAPTDAQSLRGRQIFLDSTCAACHAVANTTAAGTAGPDLTHLASRRQLAAGTIPNTPDELASWVGDPQAVKPGNRMPAEKLSGPDLQALVSYLESLK